MKNRIVSCLAAALGSALCFAHDLPPRLGISQSEGAAGLRIEGEVGRRYRLEAASNGFGPADWQYLLTLTLTNSVQNWSEPHSGSQRFYRLQREDATLDGMAANFRLIDHQGKSRNLYYYWGDPTVSAVVLIFTANGCPSVRDNLPAIKALRDQFAARGVLFWMIDSSHGASREAIAAEAAAQGIDLPVLHDPSQMVARAYNATATPEAVLINPSDWSMMYRGAVQTDPNLDQIPVPYLANALNEFLAQSEIADKESPPYGCSIEFAPQPEISYTQQIAPLLQRKCVTCHSPGNVAPWAMTSHGVVKDYSFAIKSEVLTGSMPPWHADPLYGKFTNDVSMTKEETALLLHWLDDGAPRGEGADPLVNLPPPPPKWPAKLGEPDAIIKIDPQTIKPFGVEPYRYIYTKTDYPEDRWLKAAVIRPGNTKVVHHYLVWLGQFDDARPTGITSYVPGQEPDAYPEGTGMLLPQGTWLTFNLHYTPAGTEEIDEPELGLYFHDTPPPMELRVQPILPLVLSIPPGAKEHEVAVSHTFSRSVKIYSMAPHMHFRGARMKFEAEYPDGSREVLLSVPKYDFHWQTSYTLAEPKILPRLTRIHVTGAFDNSSQNLDNPNPAQRVTWGEQSYEEMFIGYLNYSVAP